MGEVPEQPDIRTGVGTFLPFVYFLNGGRPMGRVDFRPRPIEKSGNVELEANSSLEVGGP